MSKYKIIDNCLPEQDFLELVSHIIPQTQFVDTIAWNMAPSVTQEQKLDSNNNDFYFMSMAYTNDTPVGPLWEFIVPCLNVLAPLMNIRSVMRVKGNWFPPTSVAYDHIPHKDYAEEFGEIKGAILSLNTCDGWTRLEDRTKVDSVANRLLLFNSSELHNSSTTTNPKGRFNINFNYL